MLCHRKWNQLKKLKITKLQKKKKKKSTLRLIVAFN